MSIGNNVLVYCVGIVLIFCAGYSKCRISCSDGWVTFGSACYLFGHENPVSFIEAQHYCTQHGAILIHVDDAIENAFVKDFLRRLKPNVYWMGLTDEMIEGVYQWVDTDERMTFSDFGPSQPDNAANEDCIVFWDAIDFHWNDFPCGNKYQPLCKKRELSEIAVG